MILNEDLTDGQVFSRLLFQPGLSAMAKAFDGKPQKVRLEAGATLFRLTTLADGFIFAGVWWMSRHTYDGLLNAAKGDKVQLLKLARNHLAIKMGWSPGMRAIIQIRLKRPVYAWVGPARQQKETSAGLKHITWTGGAEQIFLPNLADPNHRGASPHAAIEHTYSINVDYDWRSDPEFAG